MAIHASVAVIIPSFNCESTLRAAIESALAQRNVDHCVVVVDDGSNDRSLEIARGFEPTVRVLSGPNRGVSFARNWGIAESGSEWIVFLDSDDLLSVATLSRRAMDALETGADVVICDWQELIDDGDAPLDGAIKSVDMRPFALDPELACAMDFWAPPAAVMYRRAVVEKVGGFRSDLPVIQDARFLFDAAHQGARFSHSPHIGARYRVRPQSLSRRDPACFWRDVLLNGTQIESIWHERGTLSAERQEALADIYNSAARVLFQTGDDRYFEAVERQRQHAAVLPLHPRIAAPLSRVVGLKRARQILGILGAK